jgi:hypothetical protein
VDCLIDGVKQYNSLARVLVLIELLNHISYLLLAVVKLEGINNALIAWLPIGGSIRREPFDSYVR